MSMDAPEVVALLREVVAELRELRVAQARPAPRQRASRPDRRLWTIRATAAALGIDRARLYDLIRAGAIRTVPAGGGRQRIPLEELQRIEREGLPDADCVTAARPRRRRSASSRRKAAGGRPAAIGIGSAADQIRALKVPPCRGK